MTKMTIAATTLLGRSAKKTLCLSLFLMLGLAVPALSAFVSARSRFISPSSESCIENYRNALATSSSSCGMKNAFASPLSTTPSSPSSSARKAQTRTGDGDDCKAHEGDVPTIQVGIAGAGAVAFGMAAILAKAGHLPMLWSPSGKGTLELQSTATPALTASGAIVVHSNKTSCRTASAENEKENNDSSTFSFQPRIATSPKELVESNDILFIALPANGHKKVFDELAPHIIRRKRQQPYQQQHVIISSHASLGAIYLSQVLQEEEASASTSMEEALEDLPPIISAWGTTICTARRPSGTHVRINTIRQSVDMCTVPVQYSRPAMEVCHRLFANHNTQFVSRNGLLAVSLSNLNPQNHLGIALGNMGRIEKGEDWYQSYHITPNIGRFLEALDQERLAIAEALLLDDDDNINNLKTIFQHFSWSFHVPMTGSISDMNQEIHRIGNDVYGPNSADSRYVTEDVPFGLALIIALGNLVGRPARLHRAGMDIMSAMYGRDFMKENDLLNALELDRHSLEELKAAASTSGLLRQPQKRRRRTPAGSL